MDVLSTGLLDELWARARRPQLRASSELDRLSVLFATWCYEVNYSTLPKVARMLADPAAPLWWPSADELVADSLAGGAGASCIPLASAFAATARAENLEANVHLVNTEERVGEEPEHAVVVVHAAGRDWLCDPAFVHVQPAPLENHGGRYRRYGPAWSPIRVHAEDGVTMFEVARGASTDTTVYVLGDVCAGDALRGAYEAAGRDPRGLRLYLRRADERSQQVIAGNKVTTKDRTGMSTAVLRDERLEWWFRSAGLNRDTAEFAAEMWRSEIAAHRRLSAAR